MRPVIGPATAWSEITRLNRYRPLCGESRNRSPGRGALRLGLRTRRFGSLLIRSDLRVDGLTLRPMPPSKKELVCASARECHQKRADVRFPEGARKLVDLRVRCEGCLLAGKLRNRGGATAGIDRGRCRRMAGFGPPGPLKGGRGGA